MDVSTITHCIASDIVYAVAPLGDLARTIADILQINPSIKVCNVHGLP